MGETLIYFIPLLLVIFWIAFFMYSKKKGGGSKLSGIGKLPSGAVWDANAQIVDIQTDNKVSTMSNGMKTVVTFSDGYTYTTYYCKRESKMKLGRRTYSYSVDAEVRGQIAAAARAAHSKRS